MANIRPFVQSRNCGASRLPTNSNSSKSPLSMIWGKIINDNIVSTFWKSVAAATSVLKPVSTSSFESEASSEGKNVLGDSNKQKSNRTSNYANFKGHEIIKKDPHQTSGLEEMFFEWIGSNQNNNQNSLPAIAVEHIQKNTVISKSSLGQRSRFLVKSLCYANSPSSQTTRLEEICKHLLSYPEEKRVMIKEGLLRTVLWLKKQSSDPNVLMQVRIALALLGYLNPPAGNGICILSIDGGGTRGVMAIEIMKQLEARTNKKIYQMFDYICGVSSGAILTLLIGGLRMSLNECEMLYYQLSSEVFSQSPFWGTSGLIWSHSYYDTTLWIETLKKFFEEKLMIDTVKDEHTPKLAVVSTIMNLPSLQPFVFRNYDFPALVQSQYIGNCRHRMWEAIRASGAAPGYFQEFCLEEYLHQDGGVMINNPAALAIHEAQLLWPSENIQCVVSIGNGRYTSPIKSQIMSTSWKTKIQKIIDSATDTEGVHITLHDLLSSRTYFRFNPYLTEFLSLDEKRPEKLEQLKTDAQMYLRRNEYKFGHAVNVLSQTRPYSKKVKDWVQLQKSLIL